MYTRSYKGDEEIVIPRGYDGTALAQKSEPLPPPPMARQSTGEVKISPSESVQETDDAHETAAVPEGGSFLPRFSFLERLLPKSLFGGFRDFGTEELLIAALALFLLLSKSRDIECAIMLGLLIFIK